MKSHLRQPSPQDPPPNSGIVVAYIPRKNAQKIVIYRDLLKIIMLSLYIHIPFCVKKCHYCGFYSTQYTVANADRFVDSITIEADRIAHTFSGREFSSLYIGGGTPTVLSSHQLLTVIGIARTYFTIAPDAEVTVEANPQSGTEPFFQALRKAGVSRLSLGVQSFSDQILSMLGRPHNAEEARDAFQCARRSGFDNIGIDLIYGIPGQTMHDWSTTLYQALILRPDHVSAYSLSLDEGSNYQRKAASGSFHLPDEDAVARLYDAGVEQLAAAGFMHYEVSNFAQPGFECRHNLNYWRRGEYVGLGPGAWSFIAGRRSRSIPDLTSYCSRLAADTPLTSEDEMVGPSEAALEAVMLGLRTREGIELERIADEFGPLLRDRLLVQTAPMIAKGLLQNEAGRLFVTDRGMVLLNEVLARLSL
jgi:oxygen-independent coproporphyrinogen-3 oxidase